MNSFSNAKNAIKYYVVALFCLQFSLQISVLSAQTTVDKSLPSPIVWLEGEANKMLVQIDSQRIQLDQNEKSLEDFLYKNALPFWDTKLMARGLGGKQYRKASLSLKNSLEEQWKLTLVRYFLKAFPYYNKQRLRLEKTMNCPARNRCWLGTTVDIAGKKGIDLDFYVRWKKPKSGQSKWQVIDMRVAGVSLLKHKRGETREVLNKQGIDGLINALKIKNSVLSLTALVPGA